MFLPYTPKTGVFFGTTFSPFALKGIYQQTQSLKETLSKLAKHNKGTRTAPATLNEAVLKTHAGEASRANSSEGQAGKKTCRESLILRPFGGALYVFFVELVDVCSVL